MEEKQTATLLFLSYPAVPYIGHPRATLENYWVAVCVQTACLVNSGELDCNLEDAFPVMGTNSPNQRRKYPGKGIL